MACEPKQLLGESSLGPQISSHSQWNFECSLGFCLMWLNPTFNSPISTWEMPQTHIAIFHSIDSIKT